MSSEKISNKTSKKRAVKKASGTTRKIKKTAPVPGKKNAILILLVMILSTVLVFMGVQMLKMRNVSQKNRIEETVVEQNKSLNDSNKTNESVTRIEETDPGSALVDKTDGNTAKLPDLVTGKIYLLFFDERSEQITLRPVSRRFRSDKLLEDALSMLVRGPIQEEKTKGFETSLSTSMNINFIKIKKKIAYIDMSPAFIKDSFGDIGVARVNQVFLTLTQFDNIDAIVISVNCRKIDTMDDGRHFVWPMTTRL